MRAVADCPLLGWSHLLLLAVGCVCSGITGAFPVQDSNPLFHFSDLVRLQHLYSANEFTYAHLQIGPNGVVGGSQDETPYTVLEIKAVKPGILLIQGKKSMLYLCMDSSGHLYGSEAYKEDDCNFRELPMSDGYNLYFSETHLAPLTLQAARGPLLMQFLPRTIQNPLRWLHMDTTPFQGLREREVDGESDDPLKMQSMPIIYSPSL